MKTYCIKTAFFAAILIGGALQAQVAIGKESVTNTSVLLEFGPGNKGIVLPAVSTAPGAADGTFILDTTTKSVRVKQNGSWTDLTALGQAADNPYINTGTTDIGDGVIIGADSTTKPGVLVLESTTKALVLPSVAAPDQIVLSPVAGTMVYDTSVSMLAVYDGHNWSYWK